MGLRARRAMLLLSVVVVLAAAADLAWSVLRGEGPSSAADIAQVRGTFWAVGAGVLTFLVWAVQTWLATGPSVVTSTAEQVRAAADLLAEQSLATWSQQAILRGIVTPSPVRVHWRWATSDLGVVREDLMRAPAMYVDPPALPGIEKDEVLGSGVVARLHDEVYGRLDHGRLVVVGGPGAGKTGAMLLLMLAALRHRRSLAADLREQVPVPLWLTLGSWNPAEQGLRDWVVDWMKRDHPYVAAVDFGPDAAGHLFDAARIALFLDGLDEMPDSSRARAIRRLREESAGLRMVLTSRPDEYRAAIEAGAPVGNTAVVDLRPVGPAAAAKYLLADRTSIDTERWRPVVDRLTGQPDSLLATTLNTPLALSLARSGYQGSATDPAELLEPDLDTPEALRGHLLEQAVVAAYPDPGERERVRFWLGWLAHHMNTTAAGRTRNLLWWVIADFLPRRRRRMVLFTVAGLIGLTCGLLMGSVVGALSGPGTGWLAGLVAALGSGGLIGFTMGGTDFVEPPRMFSPRWPARSDLASSPGLSIGLVLIPPLVLALVLMDLFGVKSEWVGQFALWLLLGAAGLLIFGILVLFQSWGRSSPDTGDMSPLRIYRADRTYRLTIGAALAVSSALLTGIAGGIFFGTAQGLRVGCVAGMTTAVISALVFGLLAGLVGEAPRLWLVEFAIWTRAHGRVRFVPLLERALERQLLRRAGAAYQFRHAELQDRLAANYEREHLGP